MAAISQEEENYVRMSLMLTGISPRAVRTLFDREFPPAQLQYSLSLFPIQSTLKGLQSSRIINAAQWNLLYPANGIPLSKTFDITLMICLIRNLTRILRPVTGFDALPSSVDHTEGADLARIKYYRNILAHIDDGKINNATFTTAWNEISDAIGRLGGPGLHQECQRLKVQYLDQSNLEIITAITVAQEEINHIKETLKTLSDSHAALQEHVITKVEELHEAYTNPMPLSVKEDIDEKISEWEKDENQYEATTAETKILQKVKNKPFVIITGSPGSGKSTIAHHVALNMSKSEGYTILTFETIEPTLMIKYVHTGCKQIFVIDDICGKFILKQDMIYAWESSKIQSKLQQLFKTGVFRILSTSRLQVSESEPFWEVLKKLDATECNLKSKLYTISAKEMRKIGLKYTSEEVLKNISDEIIENIDMFPLLCKLFAKSNNKGIFSFFGNTIQEITAELNKMRRLNEGCFVGLALLVVFNNRIPKPEDKNEELFLKSSADDCFNLIDDLSDDEDCIDDNVLQVHMYVKQIQELLKTGSDVYEMVVEDCGISGRPTKKFVLSCLQTLKGTFIKESKTKISSIHDRIFDIVSLYFGQKIPKSIVEFGSSTFLWERVQFESIREKKDEFTILIPREFEEMYFNRMIAELKSKKLKTVFLNVQMKNEIFQSKFISCLDDFPNVSASLVNGKLPLILSAWYGYKCIVEFILENKKETKCRMRGKNDSDSASSDDWDSELEKKYDTDECSTQSDDDMNSLFSNSDDESVEDDCHSGASTDSNNKQIYGTFDNLSQYDETNIDEINLLEAEFEKDENVSDKAENEHDITIDEILDLKNGSLVAACINGHGKIVKILLDNMNHKQIDDSFPFLLWSCQKNNPETVKIILSNHSMSIAIKKRG